MRFPIFVCCAFAVLWSAFNASVRGGATIDGQPHSTSWKKIATPASEVWISNTGECYWDGLIVAKLSGVEYSSIEVSASSEGNAASHIETIAQTPSLTISRTIDVEPDQRRVAVRIVLTAKQDVPTLPAVELFVSGHNSNPRFYSLSENKPVTGTMMDLPLGRSLDLHGYFEAGPMKSERAEKALPWLTQLTEVSDNLVIRTAGMPMEDYGLKGTRIWAEARDPHLPAGQSVTFEIRTSVVTADEPRQKASADARQITEPRVWEFLANDPPARVGNVDVEIRPADRHAPVFTSQEVPRMRVRVRAETGAPPTRASLRVTDAFTGAPTLSADVDLSAAPDANGWLEAVAELNVPAGSVYDCRVHLTDAAGKTVEGPTAELVRCARVAQPVINAEQPPKWVLFDTIHCADEKDPHPFYSASGESKIETGSAGRYRVTAQKPSDWFGYRFDVPAGVRVCKIEVVYPDDDARYTAVSINEPVDPAKPGETWGQVRTSTGYRTGLVFPVSNTQKTFEAIYFPNSPWATVEVLNCFWTPQPAPAAVKEIRLYRLEGELPQLSNYDQTPDRIFATMSEQGQIAGLSFNVDPEFRDGHNHYGYQPPYRTLIPRDRFYKHWYQVVAQHIQYLRFRGDTGYVYGAMMYTTARYPSKYMGNPAGWTDPRYDEAALYAGMFGENGLKLVFNVEFCADYRFNQALSYTNREVLDGASTEIEIDSTGKQRALAGLVQTPSPHMASRLLRQSYGDILRELAEYYARYPGTAGVMALTGGAWIPMYYTEDAPLNDEVITLFEKKTGLKVPGNAGDPDRFAQRWAWMNHNAKKQWKSFRAEMLADFHKDMAAAVASAAPDWSYIVTHLNSVYHFGATGESNKPLDDYRSLGYDPELYRNIANLNYCRSNIGLHRAFSQTDWVPQLLEKGPMGLPDSPATRFRQFLLDKPLAMAHEGHARTSVLINTQFEEHYAWTRVNPARPWVYVGIQPNIQYSQPAGSDLLFDIVCAYARGTPDDLFYMWADGAVQMGHEPEMQHVAKFLRALPPGKYVNDARVADPIYVRRLQGGNDKIFYCVNASRSEQVARVQVGAASVKDRLSGETIAVSNDGRVNIKLSPFDMRVFEE